ncbi:MAG TPA: hypothetical protein VEI58_11255 [Chthoniobacterales bacterium]|nr:hypothetical protein [Chthoniobacterales bacterium]
MRHPNKWQLIQIDNTHDEMCAVVGVVPANEEMDDAQRSAAYLAE